MLAVNAPRHLSSNSLVWGIVNYFPFHNEMCSFTHVQARPPLRGAVGENVTALQRIPKCSIIVPVYVHLILRLWTLTKEAEVH